MKNLFWQQCYKTRNQQEKRKKTLQKNSRHIEDKKPFSNYYRKCQRKECFWTHSLKLASHWYQIGKCHIHIQITKRENYRLILLINIDASIFNKILTNCIKKLFKRITHSEQMGFFPGMQGCFNIKINQCDKPH